MKGGGRKTKSYSKYSEPITNSGGFGSGSGDDCASINFTAYLEKPQAVPLKTVVAGNILSVQAVRNVVSVHNGLDLSENGAEISNNWKAVRDLKNFSKVVNAGSIIYNFDNGNYADAGEGALSYVPRLAPYMVVVSVGKEVFAGNFTKSRAAYDADLRAQQALRNGAAARRREWHDQADRYFEQAATYMEIRDRILSELRAK